MATIRTIKPEFFADEKIGRLSAHARLAFIWLWTEADHAGRARLTPARLRAGALMFDDLGLEAAAAIIEELVSAGLIVTYQAAGEHYVFIPRLLKHQRPDRSKVRSGAMWFPPPPVELAQRHADYMEGCAWLCEGKDGEGLVGVVCPPPAPNAGAASGSRGTATGRIRDTHGTHEGPVQDERGADVGPTSDPDWTNVGRTFVPRGTHVRPTWDERSPLELEEELEEISSPLEPPQGGADIGEAPADEKPAPSPRVPFTRMLELAKQHAPGLAHFERSAMTSGDERHFRAAWAAGGEEAWVALMQRAQATALCRGDRGDRGAWGPGLVAKHRVKLMRGDYADSPTRGHLTADERRREQRRAELAAMNREGVQHTPPTALEDPAQELCRQVEGVLDAELDPPRELVRRIGGPETWQRVLELRRQPMFLDRLLELCERAVNRAA